MRTTEEFIQDMFRARRQAVSGRLFGLNPYTRLVIFFFSLILIGTCLLLLPWSTPADQKLSFIDAMFTATSAVCVTGLIVQDTATAFTPLGHTFIAMMIKIGGLGYMILASAASILLGKRLTIHERQTIQHALNLETAEGMRQFIRRVILISLAFEVAGGLLMTWPYVAEFGLWQALGIGFFHAVSGFNNAGFSLFTDNLMSQTDKPMVISIIMALVILGGIGFFVINEFIQVIQKQRTRLSVHSKLALHTTVLLLVAGAVILWLEGGLNPGQALFLSTTTRTAGFNIQNTGAMSHTALFTLIPLMFIGASPGGTGGGIKTTTFALIILSLWGTLRGRQDIVTHHRRISGELIFKALIVVASLAVMLVVITIMVLAIEEQPLVAVLFEVTSALGTVGLSIGNGGDLSLSAMFSLAGKCLIIFAMFIGRLGPLTIGLAAAFQMQHAQLRYPEGRVSIG